MAYILEDQRNWLSQYNAQDLSRTLVRQYLYQHSMFKTLHCFQTEDKQNSKKIVKSTLIRMLSINNLVVNNKKLEKQKQCKSLLMVLVQYLRNKFQQRIIKDTLSDYPSPAQIQKNKQLSLIGDRAIPELSFDKNQNQKKQKNLVDTKRKEIDQKTLTQVQFYKKKDSIKNQDSANIKLSSDIPNKEQKKQFGSRPSTAKPSVKENKQQQKISNLYLKLNAKDIKNQKLNQKKDQVSAKMNNLIEGKQKDGQKNNMKSIKSNDEKQISNQVGKNRQAANNNNAINRNFLLKNNKLEEEQNQSKNESIKRDQSSKRSSIKQDAFVKKDQKVGINLKKTEEDKFNVDEINKEQGEKNQQEYFDQFQEQNKKPDLKQKENNSQSQSKKQIKQISTQVIQQNNIKNEIETSLKKSEITKASQLQQVKAQIEKQISQVKLQKKTQSNKSQINQLNQNKTQNINIIDQPYKTSTVATRGGKKLLRKTGPELTKQQEATQMIGKDIKILDENAFQLKKEQKPRDLNENKKEFNNLQKLEVNQIKLKKPQPGSLENGNKQFQSKHQNNQPQQNMIKLKKKIKQNNAEQKPLNAKFKFDQNFIDQPLNANKEKYLYEKFCFEKMTIKPQLKPKDSDIYLQSKINYTQKPGQSSENSYVLSANKKKNQKILSTSKAEELRKIVFQKGSPYLAKAWHQGFILSSFKQTFYGLKQIEGGPCGIIAAVQCYFLKHLLYLSKLANQNDLKDQVQRENCLIGALTDILWKAKGKNQKIFLVIPTNRNFSGTKLQLSSLTEVQIQASSFEFVYESLWSYKTSFIGLSNHGVTVLIYSIVMTKGIQNIYNQIDMRQNPLIGHHGHCTQQLVNLFITGQASSNCFDGKKQLDEGFILHGIDKKSQFGFLTVFQTLQYIQVGKNLKNPIFPIWIISKEFHYHVIFGNHFLISQNNDCQKFDLIYFDGLYACDRYIRLTFDQVEKDQFGIIKQLGNIKNLPLIEQVLLKKWGRRQVDWNGGTKIL